MSHRNENVALFVLFLSDFLIKNFWSVCSCKLEGDIVSRIHQGGLIEYSSQVRPENLLIILIFLYFRVAVVRMIKMYGLHITS